MLFFPFVAPFIHRSTPAGRFWFVIKTIHSYFRNVEAAETLPTFIFFFVGFIVVFSIAGCSWASRDKNTHKASHSHTFIHMIAHQLPVTFTNESCLDRAEYPDAAAGCTVKTSLHKHLFGKIFEENMYKDFGWISAPVYNSSVQYTYLDNSNLNTNLAIMNIKK